MNRSSKVGIPLAIKKVTGTTNQRNISSLDNQWISPSKVYAAVMLSIIEYK